MIRFQVNAYFIIIMLLITFISCSKNELLEEDNNINTPDTSNTSPMIDSLYVYNITNNSATVAWNKAYDADNDKLFYSVLLNDSIVIPNVENDSIITFTELTPESNYKVTLFVTDSINDPTYISTGFVTKKSIIMFSNVYQNEFGNTHYGAAISKTSDGGYIVAGNITSETHYSFVLKIDSLGNEQWSNELSMGRGIYGNIIESHDGGFVIANSVKLIKINSEGEQIWQHPKDDSYLMHNSVIETSSRQLMVVGTATINNKNVASITRFNSDGEIIGINQIDTISAKEIKFICKAENEDYYILGESYANSNNNIWVSKINEYGEIIWIRSYNSNSYDFAYQIKLGHKSGCIVSGFSMGDRDITNARILKIDTNGELIFEKKFLWDSFKTYAYGLEPTEDGGIIFTGGNGYSPEECILVKLDQNGELKWHQKYYPEDNLDYIWIGKDIKTTYDGGFIISGIKSWVWSDSGKESGLWILKTDENGNYHY